MGHDPNIYPVGEPMKGFKGNWSVLLAMVENALEQTRREDVQRDAELIHVRDNGLDHGRHPGHG